MRAHARLWVVGELPCEGEYVTRADPASPHVIDVDVVELVEVRPERVAVLVDQLAERFDSPTALP